MVVNVVHVITHSHISTHPNSYTSHPTAQRKTIEHFTNELRDRDMKIQTLMDRQTEVSNDLGKFKVTTVCCTRRAFHQYALFYLRRTYNVLPTTLCISYYRTHTQHAPTPTRTLRCAHPHALQVDTANKLSKLAPQTKVDGIVKDAAELRGLMLIQRFLKN